MLFHRREGYHGLSGVRATRIRADQGIRVMVYKDVFFNMEHDVRFNNRPAPGRKQTDHAYIFGIGYEFG